VFVLPSAQLLPILGSRILGERRATRTKLALKWQAPEVGLWEINPVKNAGHVRTAALKLLETTGNGREHLGTDLPERGLGASLSVSDFPSTWFETLRR
jgi:hypothetical protein